MRGREPIAVTDIAGLRWCDPVSWVVAAALTLVSLPFLIARVAGGQPPNPGPKLAAFAPAGIVPAVAGVAVAALSSWWLALLLAVPALILVAWQCPPLRPRPRTGRGTHPPGQVLRVLTLNVKGGAADADAITAVVAALEVDILAVQELTAGLARRLALSGLDDVLPRSHLDPREGSRGSGLWSHWPLTPLAPVEGMRAATPRARIGPPGGPPVTVTVVHPVAPVADQEHRWRRELGLIQAALAGTTGPQLAAGDFNASRDHGAFRALLRSGFVDCADAARRRAWPGLTWPADRRFPPLMRLDHVLAPRDGILVLEARSVRVPDTDHLGVLAVLEVQRAEDIAQPRASATELSRATTPSGPSTTRSAG
jgi:endonuclease/exonuclease/phosphatase (EEP) superfamily protein YafD